MAENGSVVELTDTGPRIVDEIEAGVTFVDGLGVGDVKDVALCDEGLVLTIRRGKTDQRGYGRKVGIHHN